MKINLNIIKISAVFFLMLSGLHAEYTWLSDECEKGGCPGCIAIQGIIIAAAINIDGNHDSLERKIAKKYKKDILKSNLKKIDAIQEGITKSVARIRTMAHEADLDSEKLIFLLRKNKELYTLPIGANE